MLKLFKNLFHKSTLHVNYAGLSDIGQIRHKNEDCFGVLEGKNIFLVADGMGGHNSGEVASQATIEIMRHYFSDKTVKSMRGSSQETRHAMITSFEKANNVVMALAKEEDILQGMGCTLIMAFIYNTTLFTCHVGDTRCYIVSQNKIKKITTDHTVREESSGLAQNRHVVTRVIGYPFPEPPEYNKTTLQRGDRIILCSDGLWSMMDEQTICRSVAEAESPQEASRQLISIANQAGGDDNVTALTIFCE